MTTSPNPDARVQHALPVAVQLVGAVRDRDREAVAALLADVDMPALAVTLAAMVNEDQRISDMFAWTAYDVRLVPTCDPALDNSPKNTRSVHGTRSRYNRGCRGAGCVRAEREYQQVRYLREVAEGRRPQPQRPRLANTHDQFINDIQFSQTRPTSQVHEADPQRDLSVKGSVNKAIGSVDHARGAPEDSSEPADVSPRQRTLDDMHRQAS